MALSTLALLLAYQVHAPIALDMASDAEEIYLTRGFYPPEQTFNVTFRWTSGDAQIRLPGIGSGVPLRLSIDLQEFRPSPLEPQPVTIALNGRKTISFTPDVTLAAYTFALPPIAELRGDAVLDIHSDTFLPKDTVPNSTDERSLGLFIDRLQVDYEAGLVAPPLIVWGLLVAGVAALFGFWRVIGLAAHWALLSAVGLLAIEITGVIAFRLFTAHNSPWLAGTLIAAYLVALRLKNARPANQPLATSNPPPTTKTRLLQLAAFFLAWRIALVIIPILGVDVKGTRECCPEVLPQPVTSWTDAAFNTWYRWDAIWYGSIARDGYQYFGEREASNAGFFPGFPIVDGLISRVSGLPVEVSGPIVATLLTLLAGGLLFRLTQRETGDGDTAQRTVVYLLAFPAAYYLAIGYSEALYVTAVLAAFLFAREGRWGLGGAAGFIAGLARLHGALLIVPLGYEYLRQNQWKLRALFKPRVLAVFGAPLGVLAFNLYLNATFGQPAGYLSPYFQIQALFFKGIRAGAFPTFPGTTFANYLFGFLNNPPSTESVAVMGAMILLLLLTLEAWARLPRVYGLYMLTVVLFSLTSGDLISLPRFVVPMFPAFMALGLIGKRSTLDRVILIFSLLLQGVLALMFTKGYWIA